MLRPWEPTLLLALLALVVSDRGLGLVRWYVVDSVLLAVLSLGTAVSWRLSGTTAWFWLCAAAVTADLTAYVGGRPARRDPTGLLGRARPWPVFALASAASAAVWAAAVVGSARFLGGDGHHWLLLPVAMLGWAVLRRHQDAAQGRGVPRSR